MFSTSLLRDSLYTLSYGYKLPSKLYDKACYDFISFNEGIRYTAYNDSVSSSAIGRITIGIGFNMDACGAVVDWESVFGRSLDFEKAKSGEITLTDAQVQLLFEYSLLKRRRELEHIYKDCFYKMPLNERLAIEDAYFNCPALVNRRSKFYHNICDYYIKGDVKHLKLAVGELIHRSNPNNIKGIQKRREKEAELLSSFKSDGFKSNNCI